MFITGLLLYRRYKKTQISLRQIEEQARIERLKIETQNKENMEKMEKAHQLKLKELDAQKEKEIRDMKEREKNNQQVHDRLLKEIEEKYDYKRKKNERDIN